MPFVTPLPAEKAALEFACATASVRGAVDGRVGDELRRHWNEAMATELEAPARADGQRWLAAPGWSAGKHG